MLISKMNFPHRWWHVTASWRHVSVVPQTAWHWEMSSVKHEKGLKRWLWPSVVIWPPVFGTGACRRSSRKRWLCSGWPSPPAWSSSILTCAGFLTCTTSSFQPTLVTSCKLEFKVNKSTLLLLHHGKMIKTNMRLGKTKRKHFVIQTWVFFLIVGGGSEVAAQALSLPDLTQTQSRNLPADLERQECTAMEVELGKLERMMDDMEMKVNVLRWTVEPRGGQYADPISSTNSASLALLSVDEEQPGHEPGHQRSYMVVLLLLLAVALVAATLSVCVVFFS